MTNTQRIADLEQMLLETTKRLEEIERHLFNAAWQARIKGLINKDGK